MTLNYDGEYELRIFYQTAPAGHAAMTHRHTFDILLDGAINIGDTFENIGISRKDGVAENLADWLDNRYLVVFLALLSSSTTVSHAELWFIPEGTFNGVFQSTYQIGAVGTGVGDEQAAQQMTGTFRSAAGGLMRMQIMEGLVSGNARTTPPYANVSVAAYTDFIVAGESCIAARDNARPIASIAFSVGHNEKLWRKRFRAN